MQTNYMQSNYVLLACFVGVIILLWQHQKYNRVDRFGSIIRDYPPSIANSRYGLRGDLLRVSDIRNKYIWPKSHFRLNATSGQIYESRQRPHTAEGTCQKVTCPSIFGRKDGTCWHCRS